MQPWLGWDVEQVPHRSHEAWGVWFNCNNKHEHPPAQKWGKAGSSDNQGLNPAAILCRSDKVALLFASSMLVLIYSHSILTPLEQTGKRSFLLEGV